MSKTLKRNSAPARKLSFGTALAIVLGCVIGSGVFVKPGKVLVATGNSSLAILAWVLGGLLTLAGGLTIAEIAFRIPKTGGLYVYVEEIYGKLWGFLSGWVQSVIYGPALMAALALYFGSLFTQAVGVDASLVKPIAFVALFTLAAISAWSTRASASISSWTTVVKLLPIAAIGVLGLFRGHEAIFNQELPAGAGAGLGAAILATLWAYDGWIQVATLAGEIDQPAKNLPRAIIFGLSAAMIVYVVVNLSLFHVLPETEIAQLNERAAGAASTVLFGPVGGRIVGLGILVSIFGCLNGNILTLSRLPYAMASRGSFPFASIFARLNARTQTPFASIGLKVTLASIMMLFLNPDRITDIAIFSMYLFYGAIFLGIFRLRKKYGVPAAGQYRVPLYPVLPVAAFLGSIVICYSLVASAPIDALVSCAIVALGIPVYYGMNFQARRAEKRAEANPREREFEATPIRRAGEVPGLKTKAKAEPASAKWSASQ